MALGTNHLICKPAISTTTQSVKGSQQRGWRHMDMFMKAGCIFRPSAGHTLGEVHETAPGPRMASLAFESTLGFLTCRHELLELTFAGMVHCKNKQIAKRALTRSSGTSRPKQSHVPTSSGHPYHQSHYPPELVSLSDVDLARRAGIGLTSKLLASPIGGLPDLQTLIILHPASRSCQCRRIGACHAYL